MSAVTLTSVSTNFIVNSAGLYPSAPIVIVLGSVTNTSALAQNIICPFPSHKFIASSSSLCGSASPSHVAPTIEGKFVSTSIAIHLCAPCAGFVDSYSFNSSRFPRITNVLFSSAVTVTAFWFACASSLFPSPGILFTSNLSAVTSKSSLSEQNVSHNIGCVPASQSTCG